MKGLTNGNKVKHNDAKKKQQMGDNKSKTLSSLTSQKAPIIDQNYSKEVRQSHQNQVNLPTRENAQKEKIEAFELKTDNPSRTLNNSKPSTQNDRRIEAATQGGKGIEVANTQNNLKESNPKTTHNTGRKSFQNDDMKMSSDKLTGNKMNTASPSRNENYSTNNKETTSQTTTLTSSTSIPTSDGSIVISQPSNGKWHDT